MKKSEVVGIVTLMGKDTNYYKIKQSHIGRDKPRSHPLLNTYIFTKKESILGLKKGDILRCDGYPFMSRPKKLRVFRHPNTEHRNGVSHKHWINTYIPIKIGQLGTTAFWALREEQHG